MKNQKQKLRNKFYSPLKQTKKKSMNKPTEEDKRIVNGKL